MVSKALPIIVGDAASETARFVEMFDKFFDCLNVTHMGDDQKSSRKPYFTPEDNRLVV